jgi:hypothetical protein
MSLSIRRINEDHRLRPFLSSVYDNQTYIKNIIKEGKSEECFHTIISCIDDINVEIKGYISQHKDELMSGMQDVTTLADRYMNLSSISQKLYRNINKLKNETNDAYMIVNEKTYILDHIHSTSIILYQLKQYLHGKTQLDLYMLNYDDKDIRNYTNAAKIINDLERLIEINPKLLEINVISNSIVNIKKFSTNLKLLTQEKFVIAIDDKNQVNIANCLQVFYNFQSLPEIILFIIDYLIKNTIELTKNLLNFEIIHFILNGNDYQQSNSSSGNSGSKTLTASSSTSSIHNTPSKRGSSSTSSNTTTSSNSNNVNIQLKTAIQDMCDSWNNILNNNAMKVSNEMR